MKVELDALLASMGQPPTQDVEPFVTSRRFTNWHAILENGQEILIRVARMPEAHRGLLHEAAAHAKLVGTEIPTVASYELVDPSVFGAPASISNWIPGSSGLGIVDSQALAVPLLCQAVGSLRRTLEEQTTGPFGMSVVDGRFTPIRRNWADEYLARVYDWRSRADAVGASLGPLGDRLFDRVLAGRDAMAGVRRFCLIHGDLRPANLVLDISPPTEKDGPPTLQLAGVVDWEFAVMGDPLLAFALPLELPLDALAHVVAGYGPDQVKAWQADPDALLRLDAYAAGRVFQYLALVVASQVEGGGPNWGFGMDYAGMLALDRAEPGFTAQSLETVFAEDPPEVVEAAQPPDPIRAVMRRALGRSTCRPVLGVQQFGPWLGALAASLRAATHPAEGWAQDGMVFLDALGPEVALRGFEPVTDRPAWARGMDARLRGVGGTDALGAVAFCYALAALDYLDWSVPDGVLRGIESQVEILLNAATEAENPRTVVFHMVLRLAAEVGLAELLERPVDEVAQSDRRMALVEAWEDLTVFGGQTPQDRSNVDWKGRGAPDPGAWLIPTVLVAISELEDIGVPKGLLIGAICG